MRDMTRSERQDFRKAARDVIGKARGEGKITRLQRGRLLFALLSNKNVDEAADLCLAQAVACGVMSSTDAESREVVWSAIVGEIDIEKIVQFLMMILPMFL